MLELPSLQLSNGDRVTLQPFCTRALYIEIQKRQVSGVGVNEDKIKAEEMVGNMTSAENFAVKSMISKIVSSDGSEKQATDEYVNLLPVADFNLLHKAVAAITNPVIPEAEKKS